MKKYRVHIIWVIVAIIALAGGFFWGKATVRSAFDSGTYAGALGSSTRRTAGSTTGGGFVTGQISAIDSSSITLQLANGNSDVVFYSSSTAVTEPTIVSVSKLTTGTTVMIGGTTNSDGSLTAQTIQVSNGSTARGAGSSGAGRNASSGTSQ